MVDIRFILASIAGICACSSGVANPVIQSVQVTTDATVRIKPCQPVFVAMTVTMSCPDCKGKVRKVPLELQRLVTIRDREFHLEFSANPACSFMLDKMSVQSLGEETISFRVVAMLYWNAKRESFVFKEPGLYNVAFNPEGSVEVIVEEPSREGAALLAEIEESGLELELLVLGGSKIRDKVLLARVERMLAKYPDTAYTGLLSIALGFQKLKEIRGGPGVDVMEFVRSRERVARKYLEPYCRGEIKSLLQSAAAFTLAEEVLQRLRFERDMPKAEAAALRRSATQLLDKVKASPYALEFRSKADRELRELTRSLPE